MLKVYSNGDIFPLVLDGASWYVTHVYNGYDILTFEIDDSIDVYSKIAEEVKIETENNRYVVKKVSEHGNILEVEAHIDLDEWRISVLTDARWTNALLLRVLNDIKPSNWKIVGAGNYTKATTVEEQEGAAWAVVTPIEVLDKLSEVYGCVFNFDAINRTITVINPDSFTPSGQFISDEVNLKSIGFDGDSSNFATRLYAYGKKDEVTGKPLTFASINDGKEYVEDNTYSDKIISVGWSDERYIVKENLLADAKAKLKELAYPIRSYTCDVVNFNDDIWLYKVVQLLDRKRNISVNHQVVEYREYPDSPYLDVVTLSAVAPRLTTIFEKIQSDIQDEVESKIDDKLKEVEQEYQQAIKDATDKITGNKGGVFKWVLDGDGRLLELVNLCDTDNVNTAKKVWRWNAAGLGHSNNGYNGPYDLALLDDGSINADMIRAGILNANIMRAGIITDIHGNNYWNLETGEFRLSYGTDITLPSGEEKSLGDVLTENQSNLIVIIDNEYEGIPTDYKGEYEGKLLVQTWVSAYYGHQDVSADCVYLIAKSDSVNGYFDWSERIYTITDLTEDSGYVDITASYLGVLKGTKRFSVSKVKAGRPGESGTKGEKGDDAILLMIESSNGNIFKNTDIATTLTAHVYKGAKEVTGNDLAVLGTIKWYKDGGTTAVATGATLTISAGNVDNRATYTAQLEK